MASEQNSDQSPQGSGGKRKELPPATRKRLQRCFEHSNRMMAQENYDYAVTLLTDCVVADPSDYQALACFLGCLRKKYNDNKKGDNLSFIKGASVRRTVAKAESQEDWDGVIKAGVEALKLNPWDVHTLDKMATACKEMGFDESELAYLKAALEANPKDPDVCKRCAIALTERKQYDQAIGLWHRIEQVRPNDEEAQRAIASLTVEKTIAKGGYEDGDSAKKKVQAAAAASELSPIEKLEREIKRKPNEIPKYLELAALYVDAKQYDKAEEVLNRAYEISHHDSDIREKLEDVQLTNLRQQQDAAKKACQEMDSEEGKLRLKEIEAKINSKELEIYKNRCERFPNNLGFKYELGVKYLANGHYSEAIAEFQQSRNDPRRKGYSMLHLGQCFQQIKQYRLAMSHYDEATQEIPDRDGEGKNKAQYLAGRLAFFLKDFDTAERHLTEVAARNFAYKDVATLLDRIPKERDNQANSGEPDNG
jgi:tetratricopeptide (TPR) repeat protein